MSANLHILEASGRLTPHKNLLLETADNALQDIKARIHLPAVDIVLQDFPSGAIPGNLTGGDCYEAHLVRVAIDPNFKDFKNKIVDDLRSTLAHELHHSARSATVGFGDTLRESLISEGLAAHFDIAINGGEPKPWDVAVEDDELKEVKEMAEDELNSENYNHASWFFGDEDRGIPQSAGYSLAFALVGAYLKGSDQTAAELVDVSASNINTGYFFDT